jgi:hypothetical protein
MESTSASRPSREHDLKVRGQAGCREVSKREFERLLIPMLVPLCGTALWMTRNHEDAEDLAKIGIWQRPDSRLAFLHCAHST